MSEISRRNALKLAAAAGVVALIGNTEAAEEKKSDDKWRAWAVTEGSATKLVVEGIYNMGGPGLVVIVKDASPQGINPKVLLLELKTATLPGIWPQVIQPVPACYTKAPYTQGRYDAVQIRYPGGENIEIKQIIDAGKGPK